MSAFEHNILLLSFVYASALTHLLPCVAQGHLYPIAPAGFLLR
jgi:hypothetical protein